jgi:hypothetical protein
MESSYVNSDYCAACHHSQPLQIAEDFGYCCQDSESVSRIHLSIDRYF